VQDLSGTSISHYRIIEPLGRGGMGVVYKAEDTKLKRTVALKFLPSEYSSDIAAKERFVHEAQAASALDHPNICTIHEIGETEDGQSYIAMACYEGISLKDRIVGLDVGAHRDAPDGDTPLYPPLPGGKQIGGLSIDESINITIQIAKGLARAHEKGIVHRDIKPANIIITDQDEVKILDFGLAKLAGQTRLTKTGSTVGTIAYMSPEQTKGEMVDQRTDIWSLGVVMYEMLTGKLPFGGDYEQAMVYSIINEEPLQVSVLNEDISTELEEIVHKCLTKNVDERYQTVDDLLVDFKGFSKELDISFDESLPKILQRVWRKKIVRQITVAATSIVLLVTAILILWPTITEPIPIAVISVKNLTGEKNNDILSTSIPYSLIVSLGQLEKFKVISWERLTEVKKRVGKDSVEFIDSELGFELCRIISVPNIVVGSIIRMGNIFSIDLKILDVESKDILKAAHSQGNGKQSILAEQINDLTRQIATGFGGLTEDTYSETHRTFTDVRTPSTEAYDYYINGKTAFLKFNIDEARQYLERAIEIDSTFAMAYLNLQDVYHRLGLPKKRLEAFKKAKKYAHHATESEQLQTEAFYAGMIEGNWNKADSIFREILKIYPTDLDALNAVAKINDRKGFKEEAIDGFNKVIEVHPDFYFGYFNLSWVYANKGDYDKAIESLQRYISIIPEADPFDTIGFFYLRMGKLDSAIINFRKALALKPDFGTSSASIAYAYAVQERYDEANKNITNYIDKKTGGPKADGYLDRGFYLAWQGRYREAYKDMQEAMTIYTDIENKDRLSACLSGKGWMLYNSGNFDESRLIFENLLDSARTPITMSGVNFALGLIDLKQEKVDSANSRLKKIENYLSDIENEFWKERRTYYKQLLSAEILISENRLTEAIADAKESSVYFNNACSPVFSLPINRDVLARAYIRNGDLNKAISEYQRLITFDPKSQDRRLIYPKYHYRLAKLYEQTGQIDKAISEHKKFLDIWKNADEDQPDFIDAKKRLARLEIQNQKPH
jgi:serine/threonine protein kinase/tetratricopeptide (TPR) repeat protein